MVERMVTHMNEDHADSVLAYVRHFGSFPKAVSAELLGLDARLMRISAKSPTGQREIEVPFEPPLTSAHDAHMTMVRMSKQAKKALEAPGPASL